MRENVFKVSHFMAIHSVITLTFNFNPHLVDREECVITVQTKYTKGLAVKNTQFFIDFVHWTGNNTFFPIAVFLSIRMS